MSISGAPNHHVLTISYNENFNTRRTEFIILENRHVFYLHHALIIFGDHKYRLVVCKGKNILLDKIYNNLKGAKIAFSKLFIKNAYKEGVIPSWSIIIRGELKKLKPPLPYKLHRNLSIGGYA